MFLIKCKVSVELYTAHLLGQHFVLVFLCHRVDPKPGWRYEARRRTGEIKAYIINSCFIKYFFTEQKKLSSGVGYDYDCDHDCDNIN